MSDQTEPAIPTGITTMKRIAVLGAGVIGLTTALKIQETGKYHVQIMTDVIPSDPKTIKYTSHWAGAYHVIDEEAGTLGEEIQRKTFHEMWALSERGSPAEDCFLRSKQTHYFATEQSRPHYFERMPNFQEVSKEDLPAGVHSGFSFDSVTIDVPIYLNYLLKQFLAKGGAFTRIHIQHIDELLEDGYPPFAIQKEIEAGISSYSTSAPVAYETPAAVVVCAGLGCRTLGGIEDLDVYPARGQTVILKAPWVRSVKVYEAPDGTWTYIIPRKSGNVVIGGTKEANDWYPKPRPETTRDILERALAICPELAPPEVRNKSSGELPKVEDLIPIIAEEAVGLRPMRKGGPRIESGFWKGPGSNGQRVPVIYNYGHGPEGYIKSIGSAYIALELLEKIFPEELDPSIITVFG
ncbi:D-aspartate oxidase [Gymnopilus junonius]|uniref:D-aspartate oxidase n=1 Tax=Gymnopilus junonius TaxID=109634 RepID=A0A9P5NVL4_GYMJU|nr:D-aspartate oxidase [Gymnopilus junonius]